MAPTLEEANVAIAQINADANRYDNLLEYELASNVRADNFNLLTQQGRDQLSIFEQSIAADAEMYDKTLAHALELSDRAGDEGFSGAAGTPFTNVTYEETNLASFIPLLVIGVVLWYSMKG